MTNLIEEKANRVYAPGINFIKGRRMMSNQCAQRNNCTKEEISSLTVLLDTFPLNSTINATEGKDIVVTEVKGSCLNTIMKEETLMKIIGKEAGLFCEIDLYLKVCNI